MGDRWDDGPGRTRIERCVADIVERIRCLESSPIGASDTAKSRLDVLVRDCGSQRRSQEQVDALGRALIDAGLFFDPDLTDLRLEPDALVRFARHPLTGAQVDKQLFPSEFGLETYLKQNVGRIPGLDRLKVIRTQFELPSGTRIDLLCEDRDTGDLVVVELKRALPDRGIASQTLEYVKALAGTPFAAGRRARGLIITGAPDYTLQRDALALATHYGYDLTWMIYDVAMTVATYASTITDDPRRTPEPSASSPRPEGSPFISESFELYGIVNPQSPAVAQYAAEPHDGSEIHFDEYGHRINPDMP